MSRETFGFFNESSQIHVKSKCIYYHDREHNLAKAYQNLKRTVAASLSLQKWWLGEDPFLLGRGPGSVLSGANSL